MYGDEVNESKVLPAGVHKVCLKEVKLVELSTENYDGVVADVIFEGKNGTFRKRIFPIDPAKVTKGYQEYLKKNQGVKNILLSEQEYTRLRYQDTNLFFKRLLTAYLDEETYLDYLGKWRKNVKNPTFAEFIKFVNLALGKANDSFSTKEMNLILAYPKGKRYPDIPNQVFLSSDDLTLTDTNATMESSKPDGFSIDKPTEKPSSNTTADDDDLPF